MGSESKQQAQAITTLETLLRMKENQLSNAIHAKDRAEMIEAEYKLILARATEYKRLLARALLQLDFGPGDVSRPLWVAASKYLGMTEEAARVLCRDIDLDPDCKIDVPAWRCEVEEVEEEASTVDKMDVLMTDDEHAAWLSEVEACSECSKLGAGMCSEHMPF